MATTDDTLTRLQSHLARVAKELSDKFAAASKEHSGTPETVANKREMALRTVMERFFPLPYKLTKGAIYDSFGARSASIDCVICAPNHPLLVDEEGHIEMPLVDGVHAAIELKPDLTDLPPDFGLTRKQRPEIIRGLEQVRTVKRLLRTEGIPFAGRLQRPRIEPTEEWRDYSLRCPTYIFSHRSQEIEKLCEYVFNYYLINNVPLAEQVDVIFILESGLIINNKVEEDSISRLKAYASWRPHLLAFESSDKTFALFLRRLLSETPPEMLMSKPVLWRYLIKMQIPKHILAYAE